MAESCPKQCRAAALTVRAALFTLVCVTIRYGAIGIRNALGGSWFLRGSKTPAGLVPAVAIASIPPVLSMRTRPQNELRLFTYTNATSFPCAEAACTVPAGETWVIDRSVDIDTLLIYGKVVWDTSKDGLTLRAGYILVGDGGHLEIGTKDLPMQKRATVYIKKGQQGPFGTRFLAGMGSGTMDIHGRRLARTWSLLAQTANKGDGELHLKDDPTYMGWRVGDRIGIATTSRGRSTVHSIESIGKNAIRLKEPLENERWGGHRDVLGYSLEMAAEVVNLERSVLITGDHDDFYETNQGLHTLMTGTGYVDIRHTRVEYCGQRDIMGRYCMHFHIMRTCPRCVFEGNAVVDSAQNGITIHGTHKSLVSNNIVWNARAAGIYTEDGNEMHNMIKQNVVICSWWEFCSVDWIKNFGLHAGIFLIGMTNDIIENRVAGHENCLWTPGGARGAGHGQTVGRVCNAHTPFGEIRGNVNHDCHRFGLYLDNQFPRNLLRDDDGMLLDHKSCEPLTADGHDNGVVNVVQDEFDWHNMFVGQYKMGDVQYVNYTSVNNMHHMYWKASKNFADGRMWHILDSKVLNDPKDPIGKMEFLGPSGPHTFGIKDTVFKGGPVIQGALMAGQHCGLGGAAGPCDVQYLLENVDLTGVQGTRIGFGASSIDAGRVLPVFLSKDNSLGGHRAILSRHLNGFEKVAGCQRLGREWNEAIACPSPVRRLNIWGPNMGDLKLRGAGYEVSPDDAAPTSGMNAGRMIYEDVNGHGYGAPVLSGQRYTVEGKWVDGAVLEFSDPLLSKYLGVPDESVEVEIRGAKCSVSAADDRRYLWITGPVPRLLLTHHRTENGGFQCGGREGSKPDPTSTTTTTTTPPPPTLEEQEAHCGHSHHVCKGHNVFFSYQCLHGGLGCMAIGKRCCRYCGGEGAISSVACPGQEAQAPASTTKSPNTTSKLIVSLEDPDGRCGHGSDACGASKMFFSLDCIEGGAGCFADGKRCCRYCGDKGLPVCPEKHKSPAIEGEATTTTTPPLNPVELCGHEASLCKGKHVFFSPKCARGGLGCMALGHKCCRYCGTGAYKSVQCPSEQDDADSEKDQDEEAPARPAKEEDLESLEQQCGHEAAACRGHNVFFAKDCLRGGLGCMALGKKCCRYCGGNGAYASVKCP